MRNVLVITSSERPIAELRRALGDDVAELRVVVPTARQSRLQWLTNDDDDVRERAQEVAGDIAEALPAGVSDASAGDPDPLLAAEDALREFEADEIVVVTRPDEEASWLEERSGEAIAERFGGLKVTQLTISDEG
jgi:hypothetical protein